jgi:hypothetical protein
VHRLRLSFAGLPTTPPHHLSVDGMTPLGPNLSHWPGNRTPVQWKDDLSTGIALHFARAGVREQQAFLAGAEAVLNDHYDTDGFGALLAVLRPEVAFAREEVLLAAAGTGDFARFHTWRGFAIDRIVLNLAAEDSPAAKVFADSSGPERSLRRYDWLLQHAARVLGEPESMSSLYADELAQVQEQLAAGRRGAVQRTLHSDLGLSVVRTRGPLHRLVLNTLAGAFRVLHVIDTADGTHYRYHDRTESWFELVTFHAPPRADLRPLCAELTMREGEHDGAGWCADSPSEPVPELYFGVLGEQDYGEVTRDLRPSRLSPTEVEAAFATFFAAGAGHR